MYTRRRCANSRDLNDGQVIQRFPAEGMRYDRLLAHDAYTWQRGFELCTEAIRRYTVLTNMAVRPGTFIIREVATA